ncbi:MAG: hypothetical protein HY942_04385, partial [Gammaproteobacteria bacterium]|nr:hypothetical protein [Gammaproteobacteria bacterium]
MTASPLLAKLTVPKLGRVLTRPRLLKQLDRAAHHKLIWIAAPAGSGKTTLAAEWLKSRKRAHLWYQVDAGDQDLASFFNYLASAAERGSRLKRKLVRFTPEYALGLPAFSRNFFRALFARLKAPACIVFDNYQDVGEAAVLDSVLAHALDELPTGITLIALSRTGLPAALARHEANGQVAHLDAATLNLTPEEEAAVVKLALGERKLKPADLARLHQATHGWMAGLLLALREVRARAVGDEASVIEAIAHAPAQDPARIFDYFATEVMARLDTPTCEFLYAVALFPAMTAALSEQLTDNSKAKNILQRLVYEHFFTTRRGLLTVSYEFHPLFRQFLLAQAESHLDHESLQVLKRRAGRLLAEAGEGDAAVALLSASEDWPTLAELIRTHGAELEKQGRLQTLQQWIAALPESERVSDPWLLYWHGIAQLPTDPFVAYELFARAYPQFSDKDDVLGLYMCWIGAAMALFFRHDDMSPAPGWIAELERLRARHPKWPSLEVQARVTTAALGTLQIGDEQNPALPDWRARAEKLYRFIPIGVVRCFLGHQLGLYYSFYGHMDKLTQLAEQLKPLIESPKIPDIARVMAASIPLFAAWQTGNLTAANAAVTRLLSLTDASGVYVVSNWFYASVAYVRMSHSDLAGADEFIERFRNNSKLGNRVEMIFLEYMASWRALLFGDFELARAKSYAALAIAESISSNAFMLLQVWGVHAQSYIEVGEFAKAHTAIHNMRKLGIKTGNRLFSDFYANYLEAYLLDRSGGSLAKTLQALQRSFSAAVKHQWVVMIFWQPSLITRLCVLALQHHIEPDYARRLIRIYHFTPPASEDPIEQWPWPYRFYTLGRFSIVKDDEPLTLTGKGQKKPLDLLKTLIALGGREVGQEKLIEALWPEADGDAAQHAFETTLHRLRKLLGEDAPLALKDGRLSLDARACWVDAWAFERLLARLEDRLRINSLDALDPLTHTLFDLYQGAFLHHESELPATLSLRERLRSR